VTGPQCREHRHGAQVRIHRELRPQRQQAGFGSEVAGAWSSEGSPTAPSSTRRPAPRRRASLRKRIPRGGHTRRADGKAPQREADAEAVADGLERSLRFSKSPRPTRRNGSRTREPGEEYSHRPCSSATDRLREVIAEAERTLEAVGDRFDRSRCRRFPIGAGGCGRRGGSVSRRDAARRGAGRRRAARRGGRPLARPGAPHLRPNPACWRCGRSSRCMRTCAP